MSGKQQLITMGGEWAYQKDPYTKVRILCVDRKSDIYPVISMNDNGNIKYHRIDGTKDNIHCKDFFLVPLRHKPKEVWINKKKNGGYGPLHYKSFEEASKSLLLIEDEAVPTKFIEVVD